MERRNRPPYLAKLIISIILATIVFLLVVSFTFFVNISLYKTTSERMSQVKIYINKTSELLENTSCGESPLENATDMLSDAVNKMGFLEEEFGKKDPRVVEKKKGFSKLQYKHLQLIKKFNEKCNTSYEPVFYFYSNRKENNIISDKNKKTSYILLNFVRKHPDKFKLYSFDYNLNIKPIEKLKQKYNIKEPPVVIIKGKKVMPRNINDLEKFVEED